MASASGRGTAGGWTYDVVDLVNPVSRTRWAVLHTAESRRLSAAVSAAERRAKRKPGPDSAAAVVAAREAYSEWARAFNAREWVARPVPADVLTRSGAPSSEG